MHLLIAAAGSGSRMGANKNKLLLNVAGKPLLAWTLDSANKANAIDWIGVVGQPIDKLSILPLFDNLSKTIVWINGGKTRQESVQKGLDALPVKAKHVLIHDGARCLIEPSFFNTCAEELLNNDAVISATPVTDTIKEVDKEGFILNTPDRSNLWAAQTPQGFLVSKLKEGHEKAIANGWNVTDDASLYELLGWKVRILKGSSSNIKLTTPFDLSVAESLLTNRLLN